MRSCLSVSTLLTHIMCKLLYTPHSLYSECTSTTSYQIWSQQFLFNTTMIITVFLEQSYCCDIFYAINHVHNFSFFYFFLKFRFIFIWKVTCLSFLCMLDYDSLVPLCHFFSLRSIITIMMNSPIKSCATSWLMTSS